MPDVMGTYRIEAFQAVENAEYSRLFHNGHTGVLTELGLTNLNSAEPSWMSDPNVFVLIAIDQDE